MPKTCWPLSPITKHQSLITNHPRPSPLTNYCSYPPSRRPHADVSGPINTRKSFLALGVNNTAWYKTDVFPFVSRTVIRSTRVVRTNSNSQGIDWMLARIRSLWRVHRLSSIRGARSSRIKTGLSLVTSSILTPCSAVSRLGIMANCQRTKFFPSVR